MRLLIPPIAFVFFYRALRARPRDWREAMLGAAALCGTSVVAITEILSLRLWLTRDGVTAAWLLVCTGAFLWWRAALKKEQDIQTAEELRLDQPMDQAMKYLLAGGGLIVLLVALIAFVAPPSAWDAMSYHLPRVVMWMSNRSVHFFPTPDYSHLIFGPWSEYAMMHTYLLWGTDRFVNFVELFCFIGCAIGVSWIAQMLGAKARGQALAALACITIPVGVLEASGALNTYVVSFWIMTTVAFLLRWNSDPGWFNTICVGLSAGLAILTKGHAYVYLPFLVLACWRAGSPPTRILFLKRSAAILLLIVSVDAGQFVRCYELTGSPIGLPFADGGPRLHWRMDRHDPRALAANVIRNSAIYLSVPLDSLNVRMDRAVRRTMEELGMDPDDPLSVWPDYPFHLDHFSMHELHAVNPIHFALLVLSIGVVFVKRRDLSLGVGLYALALLLGFLFFCFTLRWQNAQSRHHLPLFVLDAALVGLLFERFLSRKAADVLGVIVLAYALPFALSNRTRSLVPWHKVDDVYHPRSILYFNDQHEDLTPSFIAAADFVNQTNCPNVAVEEYTNKAASEEEDEKSFYAYPIFPLIHADGRRRTVWYTGVRNLSMRYETRSRHGNACAVVCLDCVNVPQKWADYRGVGGRASVYGYIVVFNRFGGLANTEATVRALAAGTESEKSAPAVQQ
jgi:4-amino-4-deoxy-L-arabinose transferase-like glycosyltransferase